MKFFILDQIQQINVINNSKSLEEQLQKLKSFISQIETIDLRHKKQIASWCVKLFFKEKVKHPAKLAIQNVFNRSKQRDVLVSSFAEEIRLKCSSNEDEKSLPADSYHFISCLNEASQNFIFAKEAISIERQTIIAMLCRFVNDRKSSFQSKLSPARKNELSFELHGALQLSVFMFNCFNQDDLDNLELRLDLKMLYNKHCKELLTNEDLALDLKNLCGLALCEHSCIFTLDNTIRFPSSNIQETLAIAHGKVNSKFTKEQQKCLKIILSHLQELSNGKVALDPTIILAISRIYSQASKKSVGLLKKAKDTQSSWEGWQYNDYDLREFTLPFVLNNIEHHIDSVRHLAKETLENIIEFAAEVDEVNDFVEKFYAYPDFKIRALFMSVALPRTNPVIPFNQLKSLHHALIGDLYGMSCINQNSFKLFDVLAEICKRTSTHDEWFENFIMFLLQYDDNINNISIQDVLENTLFRQILKDKTALQKIIEARDSIKRKNSFYRVISRTNKIGAFDDKNSSAELWRELLPYQEIKDAMVDGDDRIRNSAFSLIVESKKTTQEFIAIEFKCILHFLKYNVNVQSPSSRQNIFGMLKNFFERIQSILQIINKRKDEEKINFYFNFLRDLQIFCLENLFEGANFSRRVLSLRILFYVLEATKQQHFANRTEDIWDQEKFDILMKVFNDSYEANKGMMIEIMHLIPRNVIRKYSTVDLEQVQTLVTSIKPPENLTATYLCEFYATFMQDEIKDTPVVHSAYLTTLRWCIGLLSDGLALAEKSLIVASSLNPLYGLIYTIRHLISKLSLETLTNEVEWRKFFSALIPLSRRLTEVVAPVVNSSAPEGILPNEQVEGLGAETAQEWQEIVEKTTPQIILLCSWRTVKETSLLLGDISSRAPVTSKNQQGLLTVDEIIGISDHFLELLGNTKHRGAFEQCFFGFSQLCLRLWTSKEDELHQLPSKELHSLIALISGNSKDDSELLTMKSLCSTRRSAGLPFVIQALITSELKVGKNQNFHFVMENLVACARSGECLETRTHSLNILRALFRCSDLGEPILAYIEDGIRIAIQGYEASSWIERNSSTLLFASLMVRIFGVQKTKDDEELNIRNKMTGRIFFLRYPKLYDFFMEELEKASKFVERAECNSKLHPLLLILNRLYPSSLEGSESNLKVEKFVPHVTHCSGCVEMQTRVLCAKFIANVLRQELLMPRIYETIDILKTNDSLLSNFSHGMLLQIHYLIKKLPNDVRNVVDLVEKLSTIVDRYKKQLICYATVLDIHLEIIIKYPTLLTASRNVLSSYILNCNKMDITDVFGVPMVAKKMILLEFCRWKLEHFNFQDLIHLSTFKQCDRQSVQPSSNIMSNELAKHQITHTLLNMIIMSRDYEYANLMAEDYEISKQELEIGKIVEGARLIYNENYESSNDYLINVKTLDILALQHKYFKIRIEGNESVDQEMLQNRIKFNVQKALHSPEHQKKSLLKHVYNSIQDLTSFEKINFDFLPEISTDSSTHVK